MFEIGKVLKRSWQILWDYKVLWIFGFLLALLGGGSGSGGANFSWNLNKNQRLNANPAFLSGLQAQAWGRQALNWLNQNYGRFFDTQTHIIQTIIWASVIVIAIALLIGLVLAFVRYPAETAIIRMVDENETTGAKHNFKAGWALGWNRRAFRIWVIDLLIGAPMALVVLGFLAGIGVSVFNIIRSYGNAAAIGGSVVTIVLVALLFIPLALFFAMVNVWREFVVRFAAIEGTGIGESFSRGWQFFKHYFKYALLIWIVLIGVGIAVGIAMVAVAFILIPTYVIMAIPGTLVAAVTGAIGYGITSLFAAHVWPWIIGALVALPFFFAVTLSPLSFVRGWVTVFTSNIWTLTYHQLKAIEAVPPVMPLPIPVQPDSGNPSL